MLYERRDIKRRHLIYHLDAIVQGAPPVGGHLADLSSEGLLVITDDPLPVQHQVTLRLRMPPEWEGDAELELVTECRWSKRDINPDYHANGLYIIDAPATYMDTLQTLVRQYGFHD